MPFPFRVRGQSAFIDEMYQCEYGRYEDAQRAREAGDTAAIEAGGYTLVYCDFGARYNGVIRCDNAAELSELWYALSSGTIGEHYPTQTRNMRKRIRPMVATHAPDILRQWP